ncbi:MAG: hypothetical protein OEY33_09795 [Bdellovibrionales bacterium]|nr:hypothetical protein [Bdellovibrionales bacterium]
MISIDNAELFKRHPHIQSQIHAKKLDKLIGYRIAKIEVKLLQKYKAYYKEAGETNRKTYFEGTQTWFGLHPQVLQTPYNDIYEALSSLKDQQISRVVDIGSAYGRVGLITKNIFPKASFIGFEIVKKRADEANRVFGKYNLINCEVVNKNILSDDFILPEADVYFIYDFSDREDIKKAIMLICKRMKSKKFFLFARGDSVESILKKKINFILSKTRYLPDSLIRIYEFRSDSFNC